VLAESRARDFPIDSEPADYDLSVLIVGIDMSARDHCDPAWRKHRGGESEISWL